MDALYASTNSLSDIGNSDIVKDGKPDLPTHPGEKPSKVAHKKWAALWRASLTTLGYGSFLRGELPAEIQLLADRTLLPEGSPVNPAIVAKNGDIAYANAQNKIKRDALLVEYKNRAYAKLMPSLESKAPLRLKRLKEKHQIKDSSGSPILNSYDGIAIFLEEETEAEAGAVSEYDESRFTLAYDKLKVKPLGSNISPDSFASRINLFMTHVNPYLGDGELKDERLSKFILGQLPEELGADVRSLRRELDSASELGTPTVVLAKAQKLVEDSFKPDKKAASDDGLHVVAVCLGYAAEKSAVQITSDEAKGSGAALVAAEVKKAVAAAMAATGANGKQLSGRAKKQAAKRAAAAIAAATANADKPKLRNGIRLPPGERCSKGTCDFAHDRTNPDSPCYRDPRWGGPLPPSVSDEARARIIADRITEGKRLGITPKALAPTVNMAVGQDATDACPPALKDLLAGAGYMLEGDELDSLVDVDPESGYSLDGLVSPEVGELEDESGYTPAQLAGLAAAYKSLESPAAMGDTGASRHVFSTPGSLRPAASLESHSAGAPFTDMGAGCIPGGCNCAAFDPPVSVPAVRSPMADPVVTQTTSPPPKTVPTPPTQPAVKPAGPAAIPEPVVTTEPELKCQEAADDEPVKPPSKRTLVPPSRVGEFAESMGSLLLALSLVCILGLSFYCAVNGPDGCHAVVMQLLSGVCLSQGGPGVARSFALMMAKRDECALLPPPPNLSVLQLAAACTAVIYLSVCLAQHAMFTMCTREIARLARGAAALVDPRAVARQGMTILGLGATIFCLISMLPGVGSAAVTVGANDSLVVRMHDISRAGMNLVPGDLGDRLRFVVDEVSMVHTGRVHAPVFMAESEVRHLAYNLGVKKLKKNQALTIGDTGAAFDVLTNASRAIPGSVRPNHVAVKTANGSVVPELQCDYVMELDMEDGSRQSIVRHNALIMPTCAHNLVSLGNMARDANVSVTLGAGSDPSFISFARGRAPILNLGVIVIPEAGSGLNACFGAVAQGSRNTVNLGPGIVHARANHTHWSTVKQWHRCTSDVSPTWTAAVRDEACDSCLKANCPEVPSDRHAPQVTKPGELISFDHFKLGVKHVHGGQTTVLGIHDHYSKLNWFALLKDETTDSTIEAFELFIAYCASHGVEVKWANTDNGTPFVSHKFREFMRTQVKARFTTIAPYNPRANGAMERQWRTLSNATRALLECSKLPRNYAWYAFQQAAFVNNTLPLKGHPEECALSRFTGSKPSVSHVRVFGCVVYAKVYDRITKMSNQAVRCLNLGPAPNQSGTLCYEPSTRKLFVAAHTRFVESARPGLTINRSGYQSVVPHFADEYDADAQRADDTVDELTSPGSILDGLKAPPLSVAPPVVTDTDAPVGDSLEQADSPDDPFDMPEMQPEQGGQQQQGGTHEPGGLPELAVRSRPRRDPRIVSSKYNTGSAMIARLLAVASTTAAALTPGGEAFGNTILSVNDTARGDYFIYLGSGPHREGDFASAVKQLSNSEVYSVNIDTQHGGYAHDLSSPSVANRLIQLASSPHCLGVLATIPCSTWSAARYVQPGPEPLRRLPHHAAGIPDSEGRVPAAVTRANRIAEHAIQIAEACTEHGGVFIFENPVARDESSQFAIEGREDHASLWSLPAMIQFAKRHGERVVHFDQCRTGAATQKTTQLLCSPSVYHAVRERLGHLVCDHPPNTHGTIVGNGVSADGVYQTKPAENFTPQLNRSLAEAMLAGVSRTAGWVAAMASRIAPYTNRLVDSLSYVLTDATVGSQVDESDPHSLLHGILALHAELDDEDSEWGYSVLHAVAPYASMLEATVSSSSSFTLPSVDINTLFAVAQAKRGDSDNPSHKQAFSGPEREKWREACDEEMSNLERANVYEEVPEDSLPSWDPVHRRASELVDMMWVLKVKYNELRERVRFKARATVRGDQEVAVDVTRGLPPAASFAPTIRHNTLKLLIASGTVRAGNNTKGDAVRMHSFDITAAFLQGNAPNDRVRFVRPPAGYQRYDRRGVRLVWQLTGNVYGTTTAPRVFNQTLHAFLVGTESQETRNLDLANVEAWPKGTDVTGGLGMTQSALDPCYYYKIYPNGTRMDFGVYVDDGWSLDDAGALADYDLALLHRRFGITLNRDPKQFLGMDVTVHSATRVTLTQESYILQMADRYVSDWRARDKVMMPSTDALTKAYDKAHLREHAIDPLLIKSYGGKVGALIYTTPCVRCDAAAAIARCSRALTFPTEELSRLCDDIIVYLAQTASLGVTFDGHADRAGELYMETDSDWAVGHSTTGWCSYLAGAAVCYRSQRQPCIAMSSTEAEIIAASAGAIELVNAKGLLSEMGLPQGVSTLYVDNSGAVELSRDRKSCHRSRHVDRRFFKVRELSYEGVLRVEHIDTKLNSSDLLTKPLVWTLFEVHRRRLLNL